VTPGNPGGLMTMLAEFGTMSLAQVLEPAMQMADGYPIEEDLIRKIERDEAKLKKWPYSKKVFFPHLGEEREAPRVGEIWRQPDLMETLRKLVATEADALKAGKDRKAAIYAAYDRFYKGDIAEEFARGSREQGGLHTVADLANWKVKIEEPLKTTYRGIEVFKLTHWTQSPVMLQALNLLEPLDLRSMSYNTARYIHTIYQAMNLAYADRDFYYGDPDFPPEEPIRGLLSKDYARERWKLINAKTNNPDIRPGDPYSFEGKQNPFLSLLTNWSNLRTNVEAKTEKDRAQSEADFRAGTTSIQAADEKGWAISVTPSGGWIPACIAGNTGIGMSQRMQSFVLDPAENPFNVVAPGKRPRVTLTPTIALTNGRPFLCFSVQGGDTQDQNPVAVLSQHRRVRHDRAGSVRSCEHRELPNAQLFRQTRRRARPHHIER
jgi:gamma-glutamyltranspeptidase/glutathione hydrolase